ncbi:MAG: cyclic nucleotide-binding domain-containing protein [Desulfobacterales bacterium]
MNRTTIATNRKVSEEVINALTESPLFNALKPPELRTVAKHMNLLEVDKDKVLFNEGDKGDYICFVVDGTIDIYKEASPGKSAVIASLTKGRSIGEMAVIDSFARSATAKAITKASYLTLTQGDFDAILKEYPEIGIKILKGISRLLSLNLRMTSFRLADHMLPVS